MTITKRDLNIAWDRFYSLIASQRRCHPITKREIHVFDHRDGSYLQEIDRCQAAFRHYPSFAAMPVDQRKVVTGWGDTARRYLGSMAGAGYFKQIVLNSPEDIAAGLDGIPLKGDVSLLQAEACLSRVLSLHGIGMGTATRLLAAKRSDFFLPTTSANKEQVRRCFNERSNARGYLHLLEYVWCVPWFHAPEPTVTGERRVWHARVALLDVLFYEVPP